MKLTAFQKEILRMVFYVIVSSQFYYYVIDKETDYIYLYIAVSIGLLRGIVYILEKYDIYECDYYE